MTCRDTPDSVEDESVSDGKLRDEAVRIVDQRHGYTCEFAPSPAAHMAEYDAELHRLNRVNRG